VPYNKYPKSIVNIKRDITACIINPEKNKTHIQYINTKQVIKTKNLKKPGEIMLFLLKIIRIKSEKADIIMAAVKIICFSKK